MDQFALAYRRPNCYDSMKYLYSKLQKTDEYQYDREGYEKLLKKFAEEKEHEDKEKETTGADWVIHTRVFYVYTIFFTFLSYRQRGIEPSINQAAQQLTMLQLEVWGLLWNKPIA